MGLPPTEKRPGVLQPDGPGSKPPWLTRLDGCNIRGREAYVAGRQARRCGAAEKELGGF